MNGIVEKSDQKTVKEILNLMVRSGLIKDSEIKDIDVQEKARQIQKEAYHHTRKLLESYRDMKWAVENHTSGAIEDISGGKFNLSNVNPVMDKFFEKCEIREDFKDVKNFYNSLNAASKSYKCLTAIDNALAKLRSKPKIGQLYYDILYKTYIEDIEDISISVIAEKLNMCRTIYFKKRDAALKQLSTLMWGVPQDGAGSWIEAFLILNDT